MDHWAASTSKNLNSDPAGASTAGDSSQNPTEVVAGGSSGEPSGNPEPSQGGQVGMGVDLQRLPAGANTRTAGVSDTDLFSRGRRSFVLVLSYFSRTLSVEVSGFFLSFVLVGFNLI
ncbi:hypothetical protein TSAR_006727 [Trichomalopsis sarcophagae]|uniref:Uncharacterized protein n=1 Tax=Trichomalopsis sarcophagae TaxID=543379 RepID=A0A232ERC0_9HYME|nr:hypothetical protein TSAR_006727 [Trichomalopsis sarcophagae]